MITKAKQFFQSVVQTLEDYPISFSQYFGVYLSILTIRLTLEFFSNHRLFQADDVLHIGLWFTFIVQAFMLQLHLFSKVSIEKTAKLVISCFSFALSAPIIDILLSGKIQSKMNYLSINSFSDIMWSYLTVGGASLSRGATIGIRIEIILLVIASCHYLYTKTNSIIRTISGTFFLYTVLFISGILPYLLNQLNFLLHITFSENDRSSILLLFLINICLFCVMILRSDLPVKLSFSRKECLNWIISVSLILYGAYEANLHYPENWFLNATTIYYFPLLLLVSFFLIHLKTNFENQNTEYHHAIRNGLFLSALSSSLMIGFHAGFITALYCSILFFIYKPPFLLNNIQIIARIFHSIGMSLFFIVGWVSFHAPMVGINVIKFFLFSFLFFCYSYVIDQFYK